MEVRVNGETAAVQAEGTSPREVFGAIRAWAEMAGRTVSALLLDGEEITPEDLSRLDGSGSERPRVLDIQILDRGHVALYALRRTMALVPGLRMDLALAARSLRGGETRAGLAALERGISGLGTVEVGIQSIQRLRPPPEGALPQEAVALEILRKFLRKVHALLRVPDHAAMATLLEGEGPAVLTVCEELIRGHMARPTLY